MQVYAVLLLLPLFAYCLVQAFRDIRRRHWWLAAWGVATAGYIAWVLEGLTRGPSYRRGRAGGCWPIANARLKMQHTWKQPGIGQRCWERRAQWRAFMLRNRLLLILACASASLGTAAAGQFFDLPNPAVFARAEDRERARLLVKPCTEADVGRGCYRYDGRAIREAPCTYHIDARTTGSLPTDRCFKMKASRRYRGVWVDEFEGQAFIPDGATAPDWPGGDASSPEWRKQSDRALAARIWLNVKRVNVGHNWQQGGRKVFIEFIGRKTMYPGHYGHMGMSDHEIIVDRVISLRECPKTEACG